MAGQKQPADWVEVAKALIKHYGIHEGWWRVYLGFESSGVNANLRGQMLPAAITVVNMVGLVQEKDDLHSILAVDAAEVNPRSRILVAKGLH